MEEKYSGYRVADLKDELKKRGLPVSGKKQVLIDRLLNDDKENMKKNGIITVFAKTMMGSFYDINISKDDTGLQLKTLIAEKIRVDVKRITLYANIMTDNPLPGDVVYGMVCRRKMKDNKTLAEQGVFHESTVNVQTRLF